MDASALVNSWHLLDDCCNTAMFVFRGVELFIILLSYVCYFIYIRVLYRQAVYHANLRWVLVLVSFTDMVAMACRLAFMIDFQLHGGHPAAGNLWEFIGDIVAACTFFSMNTLAVERLVATVCFKKYERMFGGAPVVGFFGFTMQVIIGAAIIIPVFYQLISVIVLVAALVVAQLVSICFFFVLPTLSRRMYNQHRLQGIFSHRTDPAGHLSMRYQTAENVRSATLLRAFVSYQIFAEVILVVIAGLVMVVLPPPFTPLGTQIFYVAFSTKGLTTMIVPVLGHEAIKIHRRRRNAVDDNVVTIRNLNGAQMAFPRDRERELYFDSYRDMWNTPAGAGPQPPSPPRTTETAAV